ncbi:MAG TPA: DUF1491 family protein [Alphaproteobacteria bacterium]|nr:DUF1491 family protein [Alphaproteobacteria bacterium]
MIDEDGRLPTELLISAQIRIAAREGVPIVIRRRGDSNYGTVVLKINNLDGTARVLTQIRFDDELVWNPVSRTDPMKEADAERYLDQQAKGDPDSWLVEIEDRQGRHWFPGRVVTF